MGMYQRRIRACKEYLTNSVSSQAVCMKYFYVIGNYNLNQISIKCNKIKA